MKIYKLIEIIDRILNSDSVDFTGLGLIIYRDIENLPIESMNENCFVKNISDIEHIADKLISISRKDKSCHDGFHLINQHFELTGLSYYFSTPISEEFKPKRLNGSRYRTAFYGSLIKNIFCTISISSSFEVYIFLNGKEFTLDEYRLQ